MMGNRTGNKLVLIDAEPGEGNGGPIVRSGADALEQAEED